MQRAKSLRILFAGTPDFAVPALRRLIDSGYPPLAVLTQPDRPAGRGRQLQPSPVKRAALEAGIEVHQPATLRDPAVQEWIYEMQADLLIVVAYGLIIPEAVLTLPTHGCWNIHASLLPRWRGAAPIQRAIEAGDRDSGICIMQMDAGLDTGPVLHCVRVALTGEENAAELHDRLAALGAEALLDCLRRLTAGQPLLAVPQPQKDIVYARKLDKKEAQLDWSEPARVLERRIRAFNPWPVAWCEVAGERTRVWRARVVPGKHDRPPGTVLNAGPRGIEVATGAGILRLEELQRPGKRRMSAADYLNAVELPATLDGKP
ncbi:MAG: methionyl-tRNA formyltransferase [Xanthomonadales bacterium]|nr:methionyl-tRNA formyltransferase [Xanthomonadales bacterium]